MGREAALSILSYLAGMNLDGHEETAPYVGELASNKFITRTHRNHAHVLPVEVRFRNRDDEVNFALEVERVSDEERRCLGCGLGKATYIAPQLSEEFCLACHNCHNCVSVCPENAIRFIYYAKETNGGWQE